MSERSPLAVAADLARAATLPSWCYTDPALLPVEEERVFGTTWQLVGRAEQAAAPGQFFSATVGREPVLVVRGADGVLRAFSAVCRHRAGAVAPGAGSGNVLRCSYHGWTYALDGRLVGTPELDGVEAFDRGACRLPAFAVDTFVGLVFVNLDTEARPLREELAELAPGLDARGLDRMGLAFRRDFTLECNWKVYVDNYLEGYHIPVVHPGLMRELDYARYETVTYRLHSVQRAPMRRVEAPRLRSGEGPEGGEALYYWVFPNLMLNIYPDNFSTNLILPLGPEQTLTVFEWFFRERGDPDVQRKVRQTVAFSDEIQVEDIAVCEAVQRGLRSRTYDRGRFSVRRENGVHHFHGLYANRMAAAPAARAAVPIEPAASGVAADLPFLSAIPIFGALKPDALERVATHLERRVLPAGTTVVKEGDSAREMFVVESGEVEVAVRSEGGASEVVLGRLGRGACFGEMSLLDIQPRSATVRTRGEAALLVLRYRELLRIQKADPEAFTLVVMNAGREVSRRLRDTHALLLDVVRRGEEREGVLEDLFRAGYSGA